MARHAAASSIPPGSHIVYPWNALQVTSDLCGVKENAECNFTVMVCITHSKIITPELQYLDVFQEHITSAVH